MKRAIKWTCAGFLACLGALAARAEGPPSLSLPIACTLGKDCFIQQYADIDSGPGARDYRCGSATYDGHKGTDFRVLSIKTTEGKIPVLAAAAGRVKAERDGMKDLLIAGPHDKAPIEGQECGNGVVIDHGQGWETQYCHLKRGSATVTKGQTVETGTLLGFVGYSGNAQFAHLHLSVRHDGKTVDPFLGKAIDGTCQTENALPAQNMWDEGLRAKLSYSDSAIIQTGFSSAPVSTRSAELGTVAAADARSPALIFFVRLINIRKGDELRLAVKGPNGFSANAAIDPLDRNKAHYVAFAGKKLRSERWPAGSYQGRAEVVRGGKTIGEAESQIDMPE